MEVVFCEVLNEIVYALLYNPCDTMVKLSHITDKSRATLQQDRWGNIMGYWISAAEICLSMVS